MRASIKETYKGRSYLRSYLEESGEGMRTASRSNAAMKASVTFSRTCKAAERIRRVGERASGERDSERARERCLE
eukprot:515483-Rhodomonas_salina.1